MHLLWLTTKPPWPPRDGGRLVTALTLEALVRSGHTIEVVSPSGPAHDDAYAAVPRLEGVRLHLVPAPPAPWWRAAPRAWLSGRPATVARHALGPVRRACERLLDAQPRAYDVVVAEQVHALAQCEPAFARGRPVVLRAQNVESDVWAHAARRRGWLAPLLRLEAARLRRYEGRAVRRVARTVALTAADAERLRALAGGAGHVDHVPAPFPAELPGGSEALAGQPAAVLLGSAGWSPSADGATWFLRSVWPAVHAALPAARLHVFGPPDWSAAGPPAGVLSHGAPGDSQDAFAPGSVLVVPLRVGAGVRMRVLEAWARGVPVVATPEAADGLEAQDGRELLLATSGAGFADALHRLSASADLRQRLVAAGRHGLGQRHAPAAVAARWAALLADAASR